MIPSQVKNTFDHSILKKYLRLTLPNHFRPAFYRLIEECVTQIVFNKSGVDPDFRRTKKFDVKLIFVYLKFQNPFVQHFFC